MKKTALLFTLFLFSYSVIGQDKEKIKGSKIVTVEAIEIGDFDSIEVGDNIEVSLEKGEKTEIKMEADDNLHGIIAIDLSDKTLRLYTLKTIVKFKKLMLRVTYTQDLKLVISKNEALVNAVQEIQLEDITFKSFNNAKLNLNVNSKNFVLQSDDKSKTELNLKTESASIELSKNASLKALIASVDLKCDLYQKAKANLEGDVNNAIIRLDNNSDFIGSKLVLKNAELVAEGYSNCSINSNDAISIDASGNSEIQIYGVQKIEMKRFVDSAILVKKSTK
jgi:hypothetical protein